MSNLKNKRIITAALTGSLSPKTKNPAVPVTAEEITEDAYKCWKAGASIVHLHTRDLKTDGQVIDYEIFAEAQRLIKEKCDVIVNMTTTGNLDEGPLIDKRVGHIKQLKPEMCSYDAGSFNWYIPGMGSFVFWNPPEFLESLGQTCIECNVKPEIEIFHPGMFDAVKYHMENGQLPPHPHFQFVLGVRGALPATPESVFELKTHMDRMFGDDCTWSGFGTSKGNLPVILTCLALGGGIRVGLEDTGYYSAGVVANNEMLVQRAARLVWEVNCEPATPDEAREMLRINR